MDLAGGGITAHFQPSSTASQVLPMFDARLESTRTQIDASDVVGIGFRQGLAEREFLDLPRTAVRTVQVRHSRAGKGPSPRSSKSLPLAKRDKP